MIVRLLTRHCLKTERDVIRDGFLIDGSAPPPESKYSCGGGKMNRRRVMSVPAHQTRIHCVGKPNDQSSEGEPYVYDGSPPPSPKYAVSTDEAYRLKLSDGFRNVARSVVSATDGLKPAVMRDGFRMMRMLPVMMGGGKPVRKMNWCVKKNDGSHQ